MQKAKIQGRDYQVAALESVYREFEAGRQSTLAVLPTGTGKTVLAAMVAERAWEEFGWRTLFLAERRTLIRQAHRTLSRFGIKAAVEMGVEDATKHAALHGKAKAVIATHQTLKGDRLNSWDEGEFGIIITDECHHALAAGYRRIYKHFPHARHLGITATPGRGDGKNLGRVYQSRAYQLRLHDAINRKILVPFEEHIAAADVDLRRLKMTKGDFNIGDLVERIGPKMETLCRGVARCIGDRQGVVFTPDQATAAAAANVLTQLGVPAKFIAGSGGKFGMSHKEQKVILDEYEQLKFQAICCAELLGEGWDNAATSFVANMKPTRSRFAYAQRLGRGLRPCPEIGKTNCLLLDFDFRVDESCRDLVTPVDLYDDGDEELPLAVRNEANQVLREGGRSVWDAIEEAENRIRSRPVVDIRLTGQAAKYEVYRRDPRGVTHILGIPALKNYDTDWKGKNPLSPAQDRYLRSLGLEDTAKLSKWGAAKLIKELKPRKEAGLASPSQVQDLLCLGVHADMARGMTAIAAARVLREHAQRRTSQ